MRRERGHTLVEMVVVLALAGLLAGAAVPSLSGLRERARMRAAARGLATLMRTLRSRAIAGAERLGPLRSRWAGLALSALRGRRRGRRARERHRRRDRSAA